MRFSCWVVLVLLAGHGHVWVGVATLWLGFGEVAGWGVGGPQLQWGTCGGGCAKYGGRWGRGGWCLPSGVLTSWIVVK